MIKRHEDALRNALDPLAYKRFVSISRRQFRLWTGVQRIRQSAWEQLVGHLPEDVDPEDLRLIEDEDDILIFYKDKMSRL